MAALRLPLPTSWLIEGLPGLTAKECVLCVVVLCCGPNLTEVLKRVWAEGFSKWVDVTIQTVAKQKGRNRKVVQ